MDNLKITNFMVQASFSQWMVFSFKASSRMEESMEMDLNSKARR